MITVISINLTEYVVFVGRNFVEHRDLNDFDIFLKGDLSTWVVKKIPVDETPIDKVYLPVVQDLFA